MKKWIAMILAGAMALSMAACGSASSGSAQDAKEETAEAASEETTAAAAEAAAETEPAAEAAADAVSTIKANGKVIMVTNAEFEPFEYKDGDAIVGIDPTIAEKIAEKLGVELEIQDIAFDSCIPALQSSKADFCAAGMSVTEDRKKNVDFTEPYFTTQQVIIVPVDSEIAARADLDGKTVGVQLGTTGDIYVTNEDGAHDLTVGDVSRYPKGVDAVSDLLTGRVDAVVIDKFPAEKLVAQNPDKIKILEETLTTEEEVEEYAIAVPKGSNLLDVINEVIAELKESGELDEILAQYNQ